MLRRVAGAVDLGRVETPAPDGTTRRRRARRRVPARIVPSIIAPRASHPSAGRVVRDPGGFLAAMPLDLETCQLVERSGRDLATAARLPQDRSAASACPGDRRRHPQEEIDPRPRSPSCRGDGCRSQAPRRPGRAGPTSVRGSATPRDRPGAVSGLLGPDRPRPPRALFVSPACSHQGMIGDRSTRLDEQQPDGAGRDGQHGRSHRDPDELRFSVGRRPPYPCPRSHFEGGRSHTQPSTPSNPRGCGRPTRALTDVTIDCHSPSNRREL